MSASLRGPLTPVIHYPNKEISMKSVTVRFNRPAGEQMRWIQLDWAPDSYTKPGQFVQATIGDRKPGFFCHRFQSWRPLELLIKNSGDAAEALCATAEGDTVQVTDPMGKGFPCGAHWRPRLGRA